VFSQAPDCGREKINVEAGRTLKTDPHLFKVSN
jgi:hypothetical protein